MNLKRPSYQRTVRWTKQGHTEPFFYIIGCCNFTEAKSCEVCTVLLNKGLFLDTVIKHDSCGPLQSVRFLHNLISLAAS